MTSQPTRDQLRALADAATPGPWEATSFESQHGTVTHLVFTDRPMEVGPVGRDEDAEFIAAARNALPQLLDQLDQAEARLHAIQRLVDQATDNHARTIPIHRIRRILDTPWQGSTTAPCGRGPCCLGSGHDGDCRQ